MHINGVTIFRNVSGFFSHKGNPQKYAFILISMDCTCTWINLKYPTLNEEPKHFPLDLTKPRTSFFVAMQQEGDQREEGT